MVVQLLVCGRYTIENSTLCLYVFNVRLGDNVKRKLFGQQEVELSLWMYQAPPFRDRGRACFSQCVRWYLCEAPQY